MRLRHSSSFASTVRRTVQWIVHLPEVLWALPITAIGLLLAAPIYLLEGEAHVIRGRTLAIVILGPFANRMLQRHPFGAMTAMALGHIVIAERQGLSLRVLKHELAHVRQAACWGPLFPFAYLASSAWALLRGRDAYWHNAFEIAARQAEQQT